VGPLQAHPAFDGATVTTQNLIGAFTVLESGDKAVPHRHTAAAIRFSTRAEGAVTSA
jgi:gentisate 1,2-dioxygenase